MGEERVGVHNLAGLSTAVDAWYRRHARSLPWRQSPADLDAGATPDPYRVWLSEVMLQQTTVPHAAPYFQRFLERWPSVGALASADWGEVSAAWAGLGYYSRARNLHACARAVAALGGFPQSAAELSDLPGVGPYTAAAIAAIAFGERVLPVDGNIERVLSRVLAIGSDRTEAGWRTAKRAIAAAASDLAAGTPDKVRPGDLAQGLMDLGAGVCTPMRPACGACPLAECCSAFRAGEAERYPEKPVKKERPVRWGAAFVAQRHGQVWLVRRPPEGLLGGMLMPPTSDWCETRMSYALDVPFSADWREIGEVRHVFTHFSLRLSVLSANLAGRSRTAGEGEWVDLHVALDALPTIGRKAVALATASQS